MRNSYASTAEQVALLAPNIPLGEEIKSMGRSEKRWSVG
jgi:hypothetical protein